METKSGHGLVSEYYNKATKTAATTTKYQNILKLSVKYFKIYNHHLYKRVPQFIIALHTFKLTSF